MKFHVRDDLLLVTCLDEDEAMALACYHRDRADVFQNDYPNEARAFYRISLWWK